jgi:tetratricopeptide (TPR) repeat protein
MFRRYFFPVLACVALLVSTGILASAQTGQLRGHVVMKQADGTAVPLADAVVDVFRVDVSGKFNTKTNKKGEFIFAGLPYVGTYVVAVSHPTAAPSWTANVKAGREIDYAIEVGPGDGKRLTQEEIKSQVSQGSSAAATGEPKATAESKAKVDEIAKKNAEIESKNANIAKTNETVNRTFKAGNDALKARNFDEAIKQYQEGLVADPEQGALYIQMSEALRMRGAERFNATVKSADTDKTAGYDAAKQDFRQSAENAQKAVQFTQKEEPRTDAVGIAEQTTRKLNALLTRMDAMRLFVTKVDTTQADAGLTAYNEYIAAETDPVKKQKARMDAAQMLLDAGAGEKAVAEYQKVLAEKPDDPDATLGAGLALYATGDKEKFQQAANYLQTFVEKAPDGHKDKETIKAVLAELKNTENITPEKTTPARRRRP